MANRYAVGTGNWTTANTGIWSTSSGGATGASVPTAADEVIFDTNTGTITISASNNVPCRSFTSTNTNTLAFAATTSQLTVGDATAGTGNVAISIGASTTITLTAVGIINLASTSATQQTITTNGKTLPSVSFGGVGSSYLLSDSMTLASTGILTLGNGTLDTNSLNHTWPNYSGTGSSTRTLTLGSSTITCNSWAQRFSGITMTANTATVSQTGSTSGFDNNSLGGGNYNGMSLVQSGAGAASVGIASGSATITLANYTRTGTSAKTDIANINHPLTCTGTFTVNGNSATNRVFVRHATPSLSRTITAATVTVTNADFMDITGAGAGSWNLSGISGGAGDCGGNSGITFTTPVTRYGVVAGNWSNTATWSTSSGGSGGASVPLPQDTVYLNASSAAGNYSIDMPRAGGTIDCTGFTRTMTFGVNTIIFGSLTLVSGMTATLSSTLTLAGRGNYTLTTAGKTYSGVTFEAPSGTYTQQDAITSTAAVVHNYGTWTTNSFTVTTLTYNSTTAGAPAVRSFNGGTSTVNITSTASANVVVMTPTGLTWSVSAGFNFTIVNTATVLRTFVLNNVDLGATTLNYTVNGSTGSMSITNGGRIGTLNFSDTTNARILQFTAGQVYAFDTFNVQGTSGKLMSVISLTGGSPVYIEEMGAVTTVDYLSVQDIVSTIPFKFYAGANSTNVSGNTNVIFTAPVTQPYIVRQGQGTLSTSTTQTVPFNYSGSATVGNLLIIGADYGSNPGSVTTPTGYTLIDTSQGTSSAYTYWWYKVATGGETSAVSTSTNSVVNGVVFLEVGGFTGTPTLDVKDKNNSAGAGVTTLSSGSGATNTANPAYALAIFGGANGLGATTGITGSWQEVRAGSSTNLALKALGLPLSANASQTVTYTWTTSRVASSQLATFYSVAGGTALSLMTMGVGV